MDVNTTKQMVSDAYDNDILNQLAEYIKIPNQSPGYDAEVLTNGYQDQAVKLMFDWATSQNVEGLTIEVMTAEGRTPIIFGVVESKPGCEDMDPLLMYGHMDKQPPLHGQWKEGLGPYDPVFIDGKLYGRGGADDGYALYSSITIVKAIQAQSSHGKIVIIIEASEESGSPDLPFWVERVYDRIGNVGLVVCLDSGCANYDQFWLTSSLRGLVSAVVTVRMLDEAVHSGSASGIVPCTFRILRQLLDRVEDSMTGRVLIDEFHTSIPEVRVVEAVHASGEIGDRAYTEFSFVSGAGPVHNDVPKLLISRTWEPQVSYVGMEGMPGLNGGNVMRTHTSLKLSIRIPPGVDKNVASAALTRELTRDIPYGAQVDIQPGFQANGWSSPPLAPWLEGVVQESSEKVFGKPARLFGEGGTIPFMGMLGEKFPNAQFVITGILGPQSNAHGPNEFLHIDMAKNITTCVAMVVEKYFHQ
jgi:acetylornithine deacetylase/succinyl-diaminopimelate desuccinylase-like protein